MRTLMRISLLLVALLAASASRSEPETQAPAAASAPGSPYPIDLATTLRLAGARGVDIQIARERLEAAKANATTATWQFLPWLSAGVSYRAHGGLIQDVVGNVLEADKDSHAAGAALNLQVDVGDAVYRTLAARQARAAAEQGLEAQRQETLVRAAQAYFEAASKAIDQNQFEVAENLLPAIAEGNPMLASQLNDKLYAAAAHNNTAQSWQPAPGMYPPYQQPMPPFMQPGDRY